MRLVPRYHYRKQVYGTLVCVECRYYAMLIQDLLDFHFRNEVREVYLYIRKTRLSYRSRRKFSKFHINL